MTGSFANEDVMEEYLSALLTDDVPVKTAPPVKTEVKPAEDKVQKQTVARLLEEVHPVVKKAPEPVIKAPTPVVDIPIPPPMVDVSVPEPATPETQTQPETSAGGGDGAVVEDSRIIEGSFQSLFFNVAGLTLAVPLTELGGIHNLEKPGPLSISYYVR
jgi:purine-binding chemotaxis protein CheW